MASFTAIFCWISVLSGITQARHTSRLQSSNIGRVIAFDPYAIQGGRLIGSSAASSSNGLSSAASSSAGSTRTVSASTMIRPRQLPSRRLGNVRRRPMITRVDGRPVLIIRPGLVQSLQNRAVRPSRIVQRPPSAQFVRVNNPVGQATSLLDILGLAPSAVTVPRGASLGTRPPGVAFLGSQGVGRVIETVINPIRYISSLPQIARSVTAAPPVAPVAPANTGLKSTVAGVVSRIGTTGLEAVSGTRKGEIVIRGPGGSIIIGPDILTGITKSAGVLPLISEFEEFEQEVGPRKNPNTIRLSDPGKGSIVLNRNPVASSGATSSALSSGGNGGILSKDPTLAASAATSSAVATSGSASASASASVAGGGVSSAASSSASSTAIGNDPVVVMGNGIVVEKANGGQTITLGKNGKQTQVITMGGAQVQIADNGSGIRAPGNSTFIVKG